MEELVSKKIGQTKKHQKIDDTENKKQVEESKVKNIEKIKISDRNNLLVHEMINITNNRKAHEALKRMSNKKATHTQAHIQ